MSKRCNLKIKKIFLSLLSVGCVVFANAQSVTVDASIDSLEILIGEQAKIKLEASFDANQKAQFPFLNDTLVAGVEIVEIAKPDTQYLNDKKRLLITQEYTVTSFDSALYNLPPFEVTVDGKPYRSKNLALKVYPIPVDTLHPDQFFGQKTIMQPPFAWEDWAGIIWLSLLAIPLLILVIFLIMRYNDNKPIIKKIKIEPKLPPHQQALKEIERIQEEKAWQKGRSKEYYTELTDTIRSYIKDRFGFNALEMTSAEILDRLLEIKDKESIQELKMLFDTADLVKFAKHDPLMNENDRNLVTAIEFVDQTKLDEPIHNKPEPTEITIEEKRSKRAKILLMSSIVALVFVIAGILVYIGTEIYNLCF